MLSLAKILHALADLLDRLGGKLLVRAPLCSGTPEAANTVAVLVSADDGASWSSVAASWCDPAGSCWCDAQGHAHEATVAVVLGPRSESLVTDTTEQVWIAAQAARGAAMVSTDPRIVASPGLDAVAVLEVAKAAALVKRFRG